MPTLIFGIVMRDSFRLEHNFV